MCKTPKDNEVDHYISTVEVQVVSVEELLSIPETSKKELVDILFFGESLV